jgi:hypothetical protein
MVSKFSVMLVAFVKFMFHNNLIDGPTVQPLYVKSKKQTFCECDGPGKRRFVSFDLGGHGIYHETLLFPRLLVAYDFLLGKLLLNKIAIGFVHL